MKRISDDLLKILFDESIEYDFVLLIVFQVVVWIELIVNYVPEYLHIVYEHLIIFDWVLRDFDRE